MASVTADLRQLRQQVERLQQEVEGRQTLAAEVVWTEDPDCVPSSWSGLVVHLTPDGLCQNEFASLKESLVRNLRQDRVDSAV